MMTQTLLDSSKYKRFTQERNKALEQINLNNQLDISRITFEALNRVTDYMSRISLLQDINASVAQALSQEMFHQIGQYFDKPIDEITKLMMNTRKHTFVLTYLAELEAIARATGKTKPVSQYDFKMKLMNQIKKDTLTGKELKTRVWQIFFRLNQDITQRFIKAAIIGLSPADTVLSAMEAYPQIKGYKLPPRTIKPIREADSEPGKEFDFYFGLTNDEDWDLAVQAYKDTELPASRFDYQAASMDPEAGYFKYDWELEQEATDDFVQQVRDGQVAAATDMGIKEFVWVAILDNKTCEKCCIPRAGKTTSEIEQMLASGTLDATHCDARVPPAHPNCRCDIGPVASIEQVEGPNWKDFGEWLET
jgi:hypothetical protein